MAVNINSNIKFTNKADAVTTEQLKVGEGAFSASRNSVTFNYGNGDGKAGLKEHKFLDDASAAKLAKVPDDTTAAIADAKKAGTDAQTAADAKVASVKAGTGITISGDATNPVVNATAQKIDMFSSSENATGAIGDELADKLVSTLTGIGGAEIANLNDGDTIIYANSYQATVTAVSGEGDAQKYTAVIFFVPQTANFATISGNATDNASLKSALDAKVNVADVHNNKVTISEGNSKIGEFTLNGDADVAIARNTFFTDNPTSADLGGTAGPFTGTFTAVDAPEGATPKVGDIIVTGNNKIARVTEITANKQPKAVVFYKGAEAVTPGAAVITVNAYGNKVADFGVNDTQNKTIDIPEPTVNLVVEEI